jgi:S-DNA-T family DNA segregation ATPase FtsK/SpoIIIE
MLLTPLLGAGIMAFAASLSGTSNLIIMALPMGGLALLGLITGLQQHRSTIQRAQHTHTARLNQYEDHLSRAEAQLRQLYEHEQTARHELSPTPEELLAIAGARGAGLPPLPRLWERRPTDDDFLDLRVGCGRVQASSTAKMPHFGDETPPDARLDRLAAAYAHFHQAPICLPLLRLGSLAVAGPRPAAWPLLAALLWQAAVLHAPGDLRLAVIAAPQHSADWAWMRWLPHSIPLTNEPAHQRRMVADSPAQIERLLGDLREQLARRHEQLERNQSSATPPTRIMLIVDGEALAHQYAAVADLLRVGGAVGMVVIVLAAGWAHAPEGCAAVLETDERGARWTQAGEPWPRERFTPDQVTLTQCDTLARQLARLKLREGGGSQDIPRQVRLFDLLNLATPADCAPPQRWADLPTNAWHPDVPIGCGADGKPVYLDLNESRHGPHGIIAGATGAGKSVLLQSIIAAFAATHPPEHLQLLLIDFKGGAALAMFQHLPHIGGMVTDLEGRLAERAIVAIKSELRRRKRLLKHVADTYSMKIEHIGDYRKAAAEHMLDPLPNLLIVVDEFDELARTYPDFVGELVRVVKQGRSLGVHLLLATQQPARAVTDEIRSQLTFFIALRLGGSDDSREMLLKPDAAFLPTDLPGRAYMRVGSDVRPLQVALVTGEYRPPAAAGPRVSFLHGDREQAIQLPSDEPVPTLRQSDLDLLIAGLCAAGALRSDQHAAIWQPPLPPRITLGEVQTLLAAPPPTQHLIAYCGLLDLPQEGRREAYWLDLSAAHLVVIGAPGSGKTMLLRTLVLSLTQHYSPNDLWCYLVDAGGQGLGPLAKLPHVGALIQARERERVRRLIRVLDTMIRTRQDQLRSADAADRAAFVRATGQPMPAILVVIDKLAVLREELREGHDDLAILDDLMRIARIGRACGVHLVLSADRSNDLGARLLALIEQRIALRMPELHDYNDLLGARVTNQLPPIAGRALIHAPDYGALELQIALPALDLPAGEHERTIQSDAELLTELRERVALMRTAWAEQIATIPPQPIELLPDQVPASTLPACSNTSTSLTIPLGQESELLSVAHLTLDVATPHCLIVGGRRSGKSSLLEQIVRSLARSSVSDVLRIAILDSPRQQLRALADLPHVALYAADQAGAADLAALIAAWPDHRPAQSRLLVILDDYVQNRERMREQLQSSYDGNKNLLQHLMEIAQTNGQHGMHLLLAANVAYADDPLVRQLDGGRNGVILWPGRYDGGTRLLGVELPRTDQRNVEQPPGRALLVREEERMIIQVAVG